ncbi:ribosomal large subunit pseudouridine synthase B [Bacillus sp. JCM 19046]|nr:ribosomal large subunit pseudouridine synthase B [Bacillus sp. JCM 19046]
MLFVCLLVSNKKTRYDGNEVSKMERLQKVIAQAGVASRRKAETYITAGRVKVNGKK